MEEEKEKDWSNIIARIIDGLIIVPLFIYIPWTYFQLGEYWFGTFLPEHLLEPEFTKFIGLYAILRFFHVVLFRIGEKK